MYNLIPILCILLVYPLSLAIYKKKQLYKYILKTITSMLFVIFGIYGGFNNLFSILIMCGLIMGLIGDILLMFKNKLYFTIGGVAFLIGHIFYALAMARLIKIDSYIYIDILMFIVLFIYLETEIYKYTNHKMDYYGWMIYLLIIITTCNISVLTNNILLVIGMILFLISDIVVFSIKYIKPVSLNRHVYGLMLYYLAQLLIAGSNLYI